MSYLKHAVALIMLVISGCEVEQQKNSPSPLVGTWLTDACTQMTGDDGTPLEHWAQGLYTFYSSGTLAARFNQYADADCITPTLLVEDLSEPATSAISYQDLGEETLEGGIPGGKIVVRAETDSSTYEFQGYYAIDNGSLCFSHKLNFDPLSISSLDTEGTDIDFEKCLTRVR